MIKIYFRQAWTMMRHNRLFSMMYIMGTAVTIALVMIFFIIFYIKIGPVYPEYNRDRMLYLESIEFNINDGNSYGTTKCSYKLYEMLKDVKGCEAVAAITGHTNNKAVKGIKNSTLMFATHSFWQMFDFEFVAGKGYSLQEEENAIAVPVAVISESMARRLFATTDAVGKNVEIQGYQHRVVGVVKDVSASTPAVGADCWLPVKSLINRTAERGNEQMLGSYQIFFLVEEGKEFDDVRHEINEIFSRFARQQPQGNKYEPFLNTHAQYMFGTKYHEGVGNVLLLFAALLLIPALNLSGMIASRMNSRMEEIGVRRAFGATNGRLIMQVLFENLLFTALGALVGLMLSYVIALYSQEWIVTLFDEVNFNMIYSEMPTVVSLEMLFNPTVISVTILLMLILNVVSALIPAIYSLRHTITASLNNKR